MPAETNLFRCLKDNYGVLIHDPVSGATAAIAASRNSATFACDSAGNTAPTLIAEFIGRLTTRPAHREPTW